MWWGIIKQKSPTVRLRLSGIYCTICCRIYLCFPKSLQASVGQYLKLGHDLFLASPYQFNNHKTRSSALLNFSAVTRLGKVRCRHSSRTHSRSFVYNMQLDLADRLWITPRHNQYLAAGLMEPQISSWHGHLWNDCIQADLGSTQDIWGGGNVNRVKTAGA
jgi:hypothetical protein